MPKRPAIVLACGVVALAVSLSARQQTVPPPVVVPPVIAPIPPTIPGVVTTTPRSTGLSTRAPMTAIVGTVVDTAGRPVPKAAVRLIGDSLIETVLTDPRGRFAFTQIPAGEMVVTAEKYGYFDGGYGQRRATGLPLPFSLPYGQAMPNMRIEVFRGAAITGSVRDESGEPIVGAHVFAARRQYVDGEWRFIGVDGNETDDRGEYRIFGLLPGEYVVTVGSMPAAPNKEYETEPSNRNLPAVFPRMFYPHARDRVIALPISLVAGDVKYGVNFALPPIRTHRISGRLIGPDAAIADQLVRLVPMDASWAGDETAKTYTTPDGSYVFDEVPEGQYRIQAGNVSPRTWTATAGVALADEINAGRPYCGTSEVIVHGGDMTVPGIEMVQSAAIAGQIELRLTKGGPLKRPPRRIMVTVEPAAPGLSRSIQLGVRTDVPFAFSNLIPGKYFVRVDGIPSGWSLDSMEIDGADTLDNPIELKEADAIVNIAIADHGTKIIGTVRDRRMQAAQGAAVIIVPGGVARENWSPNRVRETRTSTSGVFSVEGLPAGEYLIMVIDDATA